MVWQGTDFFAPTPSASSCLALPEEMRITKAALAQGYAVLAISSSDRYQSRCWNFEVDGPMVRDAIAAFRTKHSLSEAKTPLVVFGASSGGAFALMLPALIPKIKAVVSQIMGIPPHMLPEGAPPTLFVHMPRDQRTASLVQKCVRKLRQGVSHIVLRHLASGFVGWRASAEASIPARRRARFASSPQKTE